MIGTIFSVTHAMRRTPPMKMRAAMRATTMPTHQVFTPKALAKESPMELDCTMLPMKPRARMIATEKKPATNLPKAPL